MAGTEVRSSSYNLVYWVLVFIDFDATNKPYVLGSCRSVDVFYLTGQSWDLSLLRLITRYLSPSVLYLCASYIQYLSILVLRFSLRLFVLCPGCKVNY
jgi:hypothetical protein